MKRRLVLLIATLALIAAACGAEEDSAGNGFPPDDPAVSGACLAGAPDCNDTMDPGETPDDTPPPGDTSSGVVVDGGLTISEAKTTEAQGVLAVKGFLVIDDTRGVRLCELLAESFPPQCGGEALSVQGLDESESNLQEAQGVRWTDDWVTLFGEMNGDTLVISEGVTG